MKTHVLRTQFVHLAGDFSAFTTNLVLDASGDPLRSYDLDVRAKFHRLADPVVGKTAANEMAEACLAATEQDAALVKLCAKINS
jgi:hypothetical protein